jgi:hypothetical protein
MANEEHLAILKQGVEVWNQWRKENTSIVPDLSQAYINGAILSQINLSGANLNMAHLASANLILADLSGARLTMAILSEADIIQARLIRTDLTKSSLELANLTGSNLNMADLNGADLRQANFRSAKLYGANLGGALIWGTSFANVDLSEVKRLEDIRHQGPSTIGIDTLYKSKGQIPEVFLRGAGVPEELITYLPSLISGKAIQYYSCFISYSSKDEAFARRLHADLQARGVRVWFAPEDIKGGKKLHEQIPEAIRLYDKLLLVLSENSMQSEWVKTEIYHARQNEIRDNCRKLFPIGLAAFEKIREWQAFDADVGKDMAREIREYYIPDFSRWKEHDAYQAAFERLMRDLNLEG